MSAKVTSNRRPAKFIGLIILCSCLLVFGCSKTKGLDGDRYTAETPYLHLEFNLAQPAIDRLGFDPTGQRNYEILFDSNDPAKPGSIHIEAVGDGVIFRSDADRNGARFTDFEQSKAGLAFTVTDIDLTNEGQVHAGVTLRIAVSNKLPLFDLTIEEAIPAKEGVAPRPGPVITRMPGKLFTLMRNEKGAFYALGKRPSIQAELPTAGGGSAPYTQNSRNIFFYRFDREACAEPSNDPAGKCEMHAMNLKALGPKAEILMRTEGSGAFSFGLSRDIPHTESPEKSPPNSFRLSFGIEQAMEDFEPLVDFPLASAKDFPNFDRIAFFSDHLVQGIFSRTAAAPGKDLAYGLEEDLSGVFPMNYARGTAMHFFFSTALGGPRRALLLRGSLEQLLSPEGESIPPFCLPKSGASNDRSLSTGNKEVLEKVLPTCQHSNWSVRLETVLGLGIYYAMTGDLDFVKAKLPFVRKTMKAAIKLDIDGDLLPEIEPGNLMDWDAVEGETPFLTALMFKALWTQARLEAVTGNGILAKGLSEHADKLKAAANKSVASGGLWDKKLGGLIHARAKGNKITPGFSPYQNLFAIYAGLVTEPKKIARIFSYMDSNAESIYPPYGFVGLHYPKQYSGYYDSEKSCPWVAFLDTALRLRHGFAVGENHFKNQIMAHAYAGGAPFPEFTSKDDFASLSVGRSWDNAAWFEPVLRSHYGVETTCNALHLFDPKPIPGYQLTSLSSVAVGGLRFDIEYQGDRRTVSVFGEGVANLVVHGEGNSESKITLNNAPIADVKTDGGMLPFSAWGNPTEESKAVVLIHRAKPTAPDVYRIESVKKGSGE
jgi:hypothetical protein